MFRNDTPTLAHERVTVRHAHLGDERALRRLAALDSADAPALPALVAESGARIVAALPLGAGRPIADPFSPTAELVELLRLRAAQLDREPARRRLGDRLRLLRGPRARSARDGSARCAA